MSKDGNRAEYPQFSAAIDELRERFGGKLTAVDWPDGRTWGKRMQGRTMNATEWLAYVNDPLPRRLNKEACE